MSHFLKLGAVSFLMSSIALFLAIWIVIPAPIFQLLPLGVGAAEVSPWLVVINTIALLFAWKTLSSSSASRFGLIASLIALGLSLIPLLQLPSTVQRADFAMQKALGQTALNSAQMRSSPFILWDSFRGISKPTVQPTEVTFARPDNVPLKMLVYRSNQIGKKPAIVMIYGGAWRSGDPSANHEFAQYMTAQGYTVFAIDYRHTPQYKFPTQVEDVKTALRFIAQRFDEYEIDANRIAIMGRSAGGHLAMLAAYTSDVLPIRAVVNYYSPVDLTEGYNHPPFPDPIDTRAVLKSFLGGTPQELPDRYRQASPYQFVKASLPPTLMIYGDRDHIVKSSYGQALYEKLIANGNTAVLIKIPWAEHAFDAVFNGVSNQLALYYTERFLASILA